MIRRIKMLSLRYWLDSPSHLKKTIQPTPIASRPLIKRSAGNYRKHQPKTKQMLVQQLTQKFLKDLERARKTGDLNFFYTDNNKLDETLEQTGYILCDADTLSERKQTQRMANAFVSWQFGTPLVVDMWYDQSHHDMESLIQALRDIIQSNVDCKEPFFIHFTDIQLGSQSEKAIQHLLANDEDYLQAFHTRSCIDLFQKSQLMYLTPYSTNFWNAEHKRFQNHVHVLGGLIDGPYVRLSPKRIKQLGVSARCLYYTQEISKITQHGSILSMENSLKTLHELKIGKPVRYTAQLFTRWANEVKENSKHSQPHHQSLFEY